MPSNGWYRKHIPRLLPCVHFWLGVQLCASLCTLPTCFGVLRMSGQCFVTVCLATMRLSLMSQSQRLRWPVAAQLQEHWTPAAVHAAVHAAESGKPSKKHYKIHGMDAYDYWSLIKSL